MSKLLKSNAIAKGRIDRTPQLWRRKQRKRVRHNGVASETQSVARKVHTCQTSTMTADSELLGSIDPKQLAKALDVPLRTAQRWVARKQLPKPYRKLYALLVTGQLGELFPAWQAFILRADKLVTDEGFELTPSQVRAIPFTELALREHQRSVAERLDPPADSVADAQLARIEQQLAEIKAQRAASRQPAGRRYSGSPPRS